MPNFSVESYAPGKSENLARSALMDSEAFAELYQCYLPQVYRYLLARSGDEAAAQDLTAQTFMDALEGLASYRGRGSFLAWLMGIARHKAALYFRSKRLVANLEEVENLPDPAPSPERTVSARLNRTALLNSLNQISPDRAEAIYLCVIAELTSNEAAEVMGKSPAAVKMLTFRGLRDLRKLISLSSLEEIS